MSTNEVVLLALGALVPILVLSFGVLRIVKFGGWKAALFGAPIEDTVGEVDAILSKLLKMKVRVHRLGSDDEKAVALEVVAKSYLSYQMTPVVLSRAEAERLAELLQEAT